MIDTIVLTLSKKDFIITHPEKFSPSASWALAKKPFSEPLKSKQNNLKGNAKRGFYKPSLTLYQKNIYAGPLLRIELSLPKLFFGNNFAELQVKDFSSLLTKLVAVLEKMGIQITLDALAQAPVSSIHYSKNIFLTDGSTPYHYIQKIKEANIQLFLDSNQTDYRNEGHCYKWHCNSYEIVFYDKIKDLEKAKDSEKRAVEKNNAIQLNLFEALQETRRRKKCEILRMEVRLNTRKKITQLFKKLSLKNNLTFKKLFKPAIAKKVLLHYLDEIETRRSPLLDYKASGTALLADLIMNNLTLSPKKILLIYGLKQALDLVGHRQLRAMFAAYGKINWYRLISEAKAIQLPQSQSPLKVIRKQLIAFKPLSMTHLKKLGKKRKI